jgi:alpha-beta hydrolase superfamily lysophospholipase
MMLTILAVVLIAGLLIVVTMVGGVWWHQERIAYQPPPGWPGSPDDVQKSDYTAADGQRLLAYVVEPDTEPEGVLLVFHGNADLAVWQIPWARAVAQRTGWAVFLAEYRGYGGLDGKPTYAGIAEDARAAWDAARTYARQRLGAGQLAFGLYGHSLGSGVAAELASEIQRSKVAGAVPHGASSDERIVALVFQSPFTTARDMARIVSTRPVQLLWRLISRIHYDTREQFKTITAPIWIAHGSRDWLVPVWMGRELFACAQSPGGLLVVDGADHNDVAELGGDTYWRWLTNALNVRRSTLHEAISTRRTETLD